MKKSVLENFAKFTEHLFYKTPLVAASVKYEYAVIHSRTATTVFYLLWLKNI